MKRIYFFILCFIATSITAQNLQDVIYLLNGSVIRGVIIEQIPNQSLKVKTNDGSIFVYKMSEVEKMTKEQSANAKTGNNGSSYSGGLTNCYKFIKMNYNPSMYISQPGEPYNPTISGVCSLVLPGLGQMISGETKRGLGYLAGYIGGISVTGIGISLMSYGANEGLGVGIAAGGLMILVGSAGAIGMDILSIVDAVKIAKVKNMYVDDLKNRTSLLQFEVAPYIDQISLNNELVRPIGVTMRIKF